MESLVLSLWVVFLEASEVLAPCPKSHSDFVSPWFASPAVQTSARLPRRGGALRTYGKALTLCSRPASSSDTTEPDPEHCLTPC